MKKFQQYFTLSFLLLLAACSTSSPALTEQAAKLIEPTEELNSPEIATEPTPIAEGIEEPVPYEPTIQEYDVPPGSRPHDVAPAIDGGVWYTAQRLGELGWLDPRQQERHITSPWAQVLRHMVSS